MVLSKAPRDIASEFALRDPQKRALTKLHATVGAFEFSEPLKDIEAAMPGNFRFDSTFPSFCFDIATGVGKTRLAAAAMVLLVRGGVSNQFFMIAPGETIYQKMLRELDPGGDRYMFAGIAGMEDVRVITGDDYLYREPVDAKAEAVSVYVFNIQKLLKGGPKQRYKFHTYQETLGSTFAQRMRNKGNLVVLMDESHRYRGPEYFAAIAALNPILGLEFTATPVFRGNVIFEYSLKEAIADGWVKRLRPIYRQNDASLDEELDELKLRDGLKVHEITKADLDTYADAVGLARIRPMVLINTELIERANVLKARLENEFGYKGRVLVIHSSSDDDEERRLMDLEISSSDVEIVVHVNRLKEGWDVKHIFTIIPLRASISNTLTAQTIGRGVRLPFGVNNRSELARPDIAVLNVICYQKGRDNYARIVEASQQIGDVEAEDAESFVETERFTVDLFPEKTKLRVPHVEAEITASAVLKSFVPKVMISDEKSRARLIGVSSNPDEASEDLGDATVTTITNQLSFLLQSLVNHVVELQPRDIRVLARIVKAYLKNASGFDSSEEWERYLLAKRRFALDDLVMQVRQNIRTKSEVTYRVTKTSVKFAPYETLVAKGSQVRDRRSVSDNEVRRSIVGGYKRTLYQGYRFSSLQEKWLADALDDDQTVLEWLKVPEGKLTIRTPLGRYFPDFIALTSDTTYLLEVKDSSRVEEKNPTVVEKARRAAEWCEAVTQAGAGEWKHRLLRHDRIKQGDTLAGVLAGAVNLDEFV